MARSSSRGTPRIKLLCALVASCFAADALANPTGPSVVSGSASFSNVGKTLTVTNTPNAIINWQGFSIGAGEATRFQQQNTASAVLNRVAGQDPSAIFGTLSSNGRVFLINPNGVLFGQGSRIDVAGLVASTLNITDRDFLAGRLNFQAGAVAGSIVNQGEIVSASGGRIYLIAPDVQNHGLISSPNGEVLLAAGKTVSLIDADVPNLKVDVQSGGEALNVGKIIAEGGKAGIYAGLINQRGIVRADSVSKDATGRIVFKASDTTILDDGSVTSAAGAKGGEIQALGNKVGLVGTARVDASGDAGGGTVLVGGDYQGRNPDVQNAWRTYMGPQSSITADAITAGDGGKVVVWSDDATRAYGSISARGGAQAGNGGLVEISGRNWLDFGASVDTRAPFGKGGSLLLDPTTIWIAVDQAAATLAGMIGVDTTIDADVSLPDLFAAPVLESLLTTSKLTTALAGSNVTVATANPADTPGGASSGDINVVSPVSWASNFGLTLLAQRHINVGAAITNSGTGALSAYAGWNGLSTASPVISGTGAIALSAPVSFLNGNVLLRANNNITQSGSAVITASNLLASSVNGSVQLATASNSVGTLAGTFHDDFQFTNGSSLTIGTVDGVNGISTVTSPGAVPTLQLNVTGNLIVNSPISVSDGGGSDGTTSVTLNASSISVINTTITATADVNDSGDGQPASVVLNATGGGILISNSTVSANGGQGGGGGDSGGGATVALNAFGGITVNSSSAISAIGGAGAPDSISGANGGDANVALHAGGAIDTSASTLSATGGAPVNGGTAGVGTATVEVSSSSGNASPSGDIIVHNVTASNVNLQQQSLGSAKSILRASGTSLITATQVLMEADDSLNVGGGSIGTSVAPMRIQATRLEAHTHEASPGIFIDSPNAGNLQIGGVSFFAGSVRGVQALGGGDISIGVNGTLTLQSGVANSPCGVGTGGPICTTSGNVTLRAEDMVINHAIAASGTVTLATYTANRDLNVELTPSGGVLSLTPSELGTITAGTLALSAGKSIQVTGGADITAGGGPLNITLNSDSDGNNLGRISLGAGTAINSNGGNVTLGGGANPLTGYAVGDGASGGSQHGVYLSSASINAGAGNISIHGRGAAGTTNASGVQLDASSVLQTTSGSITIDGIGGAGTLGGRNRGIFILDGGTQVTSVNGTITLTGQGGSSTGFAASPVIDGRNRGIDISDGAVISTTGAGNIFLTGAGGSSVDQGSNTGVLISQPSPTGTSITTLNGNITIVGTGGTTSGASAVATANRGVSIGAAEVRSTGSGAISITGTGGTTNNNAVDSSNSGVLVQGDDVVGIMAFVQSAGGDVSIAGTAGSSTAAGTHEGMIVANRATVQSGGSGALNLTGTAPVIAIRLSGGGGLVAPMTVHAEAGGALNVTANGGGLLTLSTIGGTLNNEFVELVSGGNQTINAGGILLSGGASGSGNFVEIGAGGSQNITVGASGISITGGGGTAANSEAQIVALGTQAITVNGSGNVTLTGGSGSGNSNFARIRSTGTAQSLSFSAGGNLVLAGGTVGNLNFADLQAANATTGAQTQTISGATGISLTGGASGGGLDGSNNSLGNFARIINTNGSQGVSAGVGGISLTGGGGSLTSNFAGIFQGASTGNPGTSQTLTISNGGTVTLQGGSSAQTNVINNPSNFFRGSYAMIQGNGDSQQIDFTSGGALSLTGGSVGSNNVAQILSRFGLQTISGAPSITLQGGTGGYVDVATNKNEGNFANLNGNAGQSITASAISLTGGSAGVGNHAQIFDGGTSTAQTINATTISMLGGAGGGTDAGTGSSFGNFANIQATGTGMQSITATGLSLQAGASGQENFAVITAPTQQVTVHGNLSLTGGGSIAGTLRGGGARIGGPGGSAPAPTNLTLTVDGGVTMTGGSVADAGTAIGNNNFGGQATTITMSAGGNITLNPGTVANAGSRIGSPSSGMAGGDISITAGGTLALNSNGPGLGTAIRTLGNLTITAGSMTQGPDSQIIAGGATTLNGGTILLTSANNDFTGPVSLNSSGSNDVEIADANAIVLGASSVGTGLLTVTAGGAITQTGPIVQAAGAGQATFDSTGGGAITLTDTGNDFTGSVDLGTSGVVAITDANSFIIHGGGGGGPNASSLTINANGAVTQSAAFTGSAPTVVVINAGSGPINLSNASNNFSGNTSLAANTTGAVSLTNGNAGGINLGASTVGGALSLTSGGPVTQSGALAVGGASTINAGSNTILLANASNDFVGTVNFTGGNVTLADANAIAIGSASASGALNISATSTSFLSGLSANNYTFPSGTNSLGAGTYNLGGTTSVAQNASTGTATVVSLASGATINTSGGTVNVGAGGTLSGTGTIQGNVDNVAGTVSPGASPGMLTITGNYTQGASGVLNMEIGGLVAGTDYDQLRVGGSTTLAGTLNTALINGFVPVSGQSFTLIQSTGPISGTFTTVNQPVGALFNSFYSSTTFDFIAASGGSIPAAIIPVVQNTIVSTDQVLVALTTTTTTSSTSDTGLMFVPGGNIDVAPATTGTTTTTADGKIVPKPPACN